MCSWPALQELSSSQVDGCWLFVDIVNCAFGCSVASNCGSRPHGPNLPEPVSEVLTCPQTTLVRTHLLCSIFEGPREIVPGVFVPSRPRT